jgi:hypothetical protein
VVTRSYTKGMEQILEKELGMIHLGYLKKATEEILPSRTVVMGVFMSNVKMEKPLED